MSVLRELFVDLHAQAIDARLEPRWLVGAVQLGRDRHAGSPERGSPDDFDARRSRRRDRHVEADEKFSIRLRASFGIAISAHHGFVDLMPRRAERVGRLDLERSIVLANSVDCTGQDDGEVGVVTCAFRAFDLGRAAGARGDEYKECDDLHMVILRRCCA